MTGNHLATLSLILIVLVIGLFLPRESKSLGENLAMKRVLAHVIAEDMTEAEFNAWPHAEYRAVAYPLAPNAPYHEAPGDGKGVNWCTKKLAGNFLQSHFAVRRFNLCSGPLKTRVENGGIWKVLSLERSSAVTTNTIRILLEVERAR